jgi:hypothetical protein
MSPVSSRRYGTFHFPSTDVESETTVFVNCGSVTRIRISLSVNADDESEGVVPGAYPDAVGAYAEKFTRYFHEFTPFGVSTPGIENVSVPTGAMGIRIELGLAVLETNTAESSARVC